MRACSCSAAQETASSINAAISIIWLLLLIVTPTSCELINRKDAFIGYHEQIECSDALLECHRRARENGCLADPWTMRRFCPVACNVGSCTANSERVSQVRHKGCASSSGTKAYATRFSRVLPVEHFRPTQMRPADALLQLSSLGVGTYLGNVDAVTDEAVTTAVIYSVANGFNVIDTASNYRSGQAEVAVGHALQALLAGDAWEDFSVNDPMLANDTTRDQLFISTKAGFVSAPLVQELFDSGQLQRREVVQGIHTMQPTYLDKSLLQSLGRLGLEKVDLFYLHNAAEMQLPAVGRQVFMQRLRDAFTYLEAAREDGKLQYYGLATWECFRVPQGHKLHMALQDVVALAGEVGGREHGFRFIQLPVNVAMTESYFEAWQPVGGRNLTLLEAAQTLQVGVFGSGPLGEAELVRRMMSSMDGVPELMKLPATASKLLQVARSTPGVTAALVGHKTREFVEQNVQVAATAPLDRDAFSRVMHRVLPMVQ